MKLISWNVNGVRAVVKKGFYTWLADADPDILCLQETKAAEEQVPEELRNPDFYTSVWESGERKGYSGVATFVKGKVDLIGRGFPAEERFNGEGRILVTKHDGFTLLNVYFPNGQRDDERLNYKLKFYDAALDYCESLRKGGHELVICGDYNTAHNEIDIARPKDNENVSGFLRIERDWMDKFESFGYIDTFRRLHPNEKDAYTWWSMRTAARGRNVGWRLDYFYVTPGLFKHVKKSVILSDVQGSDHCPILLELE